MIVAAAVAFALSLGVFGTALFLATPREQRSLMFVCCVATLPMCAASFWLLRMPIDAVLVRALGSGEALFWIRTWYAPLLEEPAKLWPLLIPALCRRIDAENAGRFGVALGLGFALGEILVVARLVAASDPKVAALPWYELGGFIGERFMTVAVHGGMTAFALVIWRQNGSLLFGLAAAAMAHYAVNFPIAAAQRGWLGPAELSRALLSIWVAVCFLVALVWLATLQFGRDVGRTLYGRAKCPRCGAVYDRTLVGFNFGFSLRYEPCPVCRTWNWTERLKQADAPSE